jgi:hypothetical protein
MEPVRLYTGTKARRKERRCNKIPTSAVSRNESPRARPEPQRRR